MSVPDEASERRARAASADGPGGEGTERFRRLLIGVGFVVLLGAVVAAAIIFQSGGSTTARRHPHLPVASTTHGVALGRQAAGVHVLVYEDFAGARSRRFEMATRDFLHADAASGRVYVEYRPVALGAPGAARAVNAFATVLDTAGPRAALRFHDRLFDRTNAGTAPDAAALVGLAVHAGAHRTAVQQPIEAEQHRQWVQRADAAARRADVGRLPSVVVDGRPMVADDVIALADRLETTIARKD
jgi:hypothetical protein